MEWLVTASTSRGKKKEGRSCPLTSRNNIKDCGNPFVEIPTVYCECNILNFISGIGYAGTPDYINYSLENEKINLKK